MAVAVADIGANEWRSRIAGSFESKQENLIPILQFIQEEVGFLSPESMLAAARHLRIAESRVYGVASFYTRFKFEPQGKNRVTICGGTACHVKGSGRIEDEMASHLSVVSGGTTEDLLFTLESVACVGACALAPVVVINTGVYGRQTLASVKRTVDKLSKAEQ